MLTHHTILGVIGTSAGDVVSKMTITINGVTTSVLPVPVAAVRMGYTDRYVRLLCDTGELIAFKIAGRWLVAEHAANIYPTPDSIDHYIRL